MVVTEVEWIFRSTEFWYKSGICLLGWKARNCYYQSTGMRMTDIYCVQSAYSWLWNAKYESREREMRWIQGMHPSTGFTIFLAVLWFKVPLQSWQFKIISTWHTRHSKLSWFVIAINLSYYNCTIRLKRIIILGNSHYYTYTLTSVALL